MGERIVSAEEARELLNGIAATPWRVAPHDDPGAGEAQDADGHYVNAEGDADAQIMAAAPDLAATVVRLHNILAADRSLRRIAAGAAGMKVADEPPEWDAICEERIRAAYKLGYYNGYHTGSGDDYNDDIGVAKEPGDV